SFCDCRGHRRLRHFRVPGGLPLLERSELVPRGIFRLRDGAHGGIWARLAGPGYLPASDSVWRSDRHYHSSGTLSANHIPQPPAKDSVVAGDPAHVPESVQDRESRPLDRADPLPGRAVPCLAEPCSRLFCIAGHSFVLGPGGETWGLVVHPSTL